MEIFLVGGAVRDQLLGLPIKEKDWVVVGATVTEMLAMGFKPVGKDFPVFLHPKTKEEYALARTERKVGKGYTGFIFNTNPEVTLEEDLQRRDLTINAMAESISGKLVDPYHGKSDLEQKWLRHVSPSFVEDPVRILRVARFAARYHSLGFRVAPETMELMKEMVRLGEVNALVPERVWKELEKGLAEDHPELFFEILMKANAHPILFPEINESNHVYLKKAAARYQDKQIRFAVLFHLVSPENIIKFSNRYRIPTSYKEIALLLASNFNDYLYIDTLNAKKILLFLQRLDALRREERFKKILAALEIVSDKKQTVLIESCFNAIKNIDIKPLVKAGLKGESLGLKIKEYQLAAIEKNMNKR